MNILLLAAISTFVGVSGASRVKYVLRQGGK